MRDSRDTQLGNTTSASNATAWYNVLPPYINFTPLKSFTASQRSTFYTPAGGSILQCPRAMWNGNEKNAAGPIFSYAFNSKIFGDPAVTARCPASKSFSSFSWCHQRE